ncbi:MAG: hypothetical protein Q8Q02_05500 [Nocardioides sp.]|nr:hypothetical protein [Nocardioides sp.]
MLSSVMLLPAYADPPTRRVVHDGPTPGAAVDIARIVLRSAPAEGRKARVRIVLRKPAAAGDTLNVYFDTDGDHAPEVRYKAPASAEFTSWRMRSWRKRGRTLDTRCGRVRMELGERIAVATFDPRCLTDEVTKIRVSVRSHSQIGRPCPDWVPGKRRWTGRVLAYRP